MSDELRSCVICASENVIPVLEVVDVPVHPFHPVINKGCGIGIGSLRIVACSNCGHIYNAGFDINVADDLYGSFVLTNTPVSPEMVANVQDTATGILALAVENSTVLEIGGGTGALSMALAEHAHEVHCVEPSRALSADRFHGTNVICHQAMYPNDALVDRTFDVVVCRQVIEHVPFPEPFLCAIRHAIRSGGLVYIELPRFEYIKDNGSIVDFHYPHAHYYSKNNIEVLFKRNKFEIVNVVFLKEGHDVGYMLRPVETSHVSALEVKFREDETNNFAELLKIRRASGLARMQAVYGNIALYGANAYSQALIGLYPNFKNIRIIFDDTTSYAGHVGYGCEVEIPITLPRFEILDEIDVIIITAYLHDLGISKKLRALGYRGQLYTVRTDQSAGQDGRPSSIFH